MVSLIKEDIDYIFDYIKEYGTKKSMIHFQYSKPQMYNRIIMWSQNIISCAKFTERLYIYVYQLTTLPKCLNCKTSATRFYSFNRGYAMFCSNFCVSMSPEVRKQKEKTNIKRYDNIYPSCTDAIKNKVRKTLQNKHGVDSLVELRWKNKKKSKKLFLFLF